jgi:hypothetical protein
MKSYTVRGSTTRSRLNCPAATWIADPGQLNEAFATPASSRQYCRPMPKAAMIAIGIVVPLLVILFHPFEGNILGFCPFTKSPVHAANDVVVAVIDGGRCG